MKNRKSTKRFLWLLSFVALACQGDPGPPTEGRLLAADEDLTAEQKRLREMQYMVVVSADPDDGAEEVWDLGREGAEERIGILLGMPRGQIVCSGLYLSDLCGVERCKFKYDFEVASRILAQSEGLAISSNVMSFYGSTQEIHETSEALRVGGGGSAFAENVSSISYPPQSTATRVWFANFAASHYKRLIIQARAALDLASAAGPSCAEPEETSEVAAAALRQALVGLERANEVAARLIVAVADQQLGSSTQSSISTARGLAGEDLSRAAAAHLYLGGKPGIQGDTKKALCSSFEFTQQTQKAIDIIRQLAPPPSKILELADGFSSSSNNGGLEEFLNGTTITGGGSGAGGSSGSGGGFGSLKERFEAMRGQVVQIDTIQSHFKLRAGDFAEAIKYLAQELRAYSRNLTTVVSGGPAGTIPRYAAVATPPAEQPDAYWAALTRTDVPLDGTGNESMAPSADWRVNFLGFADPFFEIPSPSSGSWLPGSFVDWVSLTTGLASSRMGGAPEGAQKILRDLIGASESLGFFEHRSFENGDQFSARLFRDDNVAYYAAVGDDVMRCAVQGVIEGQPCNPWVSDNLENPMLAKLETDNYLIGVTSGVTTARITPMMRVGSRRAYLLRSRPGWVATPGETEPGAGDFEAVMGIPGHRVHGYGVAAQMIRQYGIVPSAEARAAEFMKLSQLDCTRPQLSCAPSASGTQLGRFDERLPLENELSEDQDGVESSWKYYLARARDAANASDALAREYVSTRLQEEQRAESQAQRAEDIQRAQEEKASAALDRVQQICGTSVDGRALLRLPDIFGNEPCPPGANPGAGWECVNGRMVRAFTRLPREIDDPDIRKLAICIQELEDRTTLQFSNSDLCYWTDAAGNICAGEGPNEGAECPKRGPTRTVAQSPASCDPGYSGGVAREDSLGIFDLADAEANELLGASTCEDVRLVRKHVAANTAVAGSDSAKNELKWALIRLGGSGVFSVSNLNRLRSALSVETTYGRYLTVRLGGRPWISTGNALDGASTSTWPCSGHALPEGYCDAQSIRCVSLQCNHGPYRDEVNDRLLDAFLALEVISQTEVLATSRALESHIEFWLPVRLGQDYYPFGYVRAARSFETTSSYGNGSIHEWKNSDWKVYTPNGPIADPRMFTRNGLALNLIGQEGEDRPYAAAFWRSHGGPWYPTVTVDAFFAGLRGNAERVYNSKGKSSTLAPGYFRNRAGGLSHMEARVLTGPMVKEPPLGVRPSAYSDRYATFAWEGPVACNDWGVDPSRLNERGLQGGLKAEGDGYAHWGCPDEGMVRFLGNSVDITQNERSLWDALELACEGQIAMIGRVSCSRPEALEDIGDLSKVSQYLDCVAGKIAQTGAKTILQGVPTKIVEELKEAAWGTPAGVDPVRGELGVQYSLIREAVTGLGMASREFSRIFRGFGVELDRINSRLKEQELKDQLAVLNFDSTAVEQITRCVAAISQASGWFQHLQTFGTHWGAAAATCANTGIQTGIASRIRDITKELNNEQRKQIFGDAETQFLLLEHAIDAQVKEVNSLAESLQRSIAQVESLRQEAYRRINDAVWYLSYEDGTRSEVVDTIMSEQTLAAQKRYTQAHQNAQRWSFLARRAIEQRLGVELNRLREDLPLVEAPQKWADSVCATSPINYQKGGDGKVRENPGFAEAFIGDYVTKLENVVESYRLQFSFQEGEDVAVVSLRDDVMNVKAECEAPSENQLFHTGRFGEARQAIESGEDVWQVVGCIEPTGMPGAGYGAACLSADQVDSPFQAPGLVDGVTRGYELTFSNGTPDCAGNAAVTDGEGIVTGGCSWTPETRLTQKRSLSPGHYRFSWYSPIVSSGPNPGAYAGGVWDEEGNPLVSQAASQSIAGNAGRVWARHFLEFELDEPKVVEVGFARGDEELIEDWEDQWKVTVGAPMLDFVESRVPSQYRGPKPYQNIGDTLTVMSPNCEDTDGDVFRATQWKSRCERVCPAGFGGICPEDAVEQCYREASFFISQRAIETGEALVQSGFARGNFNYRFDSVAVNLVGTGLRACDTSSSPSTCFGSGFVPYSLYHKGPYFVRNHYGEDYRAHLFEGVIEHARGLAAERYLSNPIGKTDRELLEDFTRTEYQGRPLDGHFVLRVWEEPGVNFSALEDVQLILKYRYWSR